jgi:hypothetical protein
VTDPRKLWREAGHILRDQGFVDIEPQPDGALAEPGGRARRQRVQSHEAVAMYYQAARAFLHSYRFPSAIQRRVWELHSEGVSVMRIERHLRREGVRGRVHQQVHDIVVALRGRMLNRKRRGRPPRPGGCYRGCIELNVKLQDGAAEALEHLVKRWGRPERDIIRTLIMEAARVS